MQLKIAKNWGHLLQEEMEKPYIKALKDFLVQESQLGALVFPPSEDVFRSLALTPPDKVKVVIVGQDPYHGPGQAHGLCFSVQEGVKIPPSLVNIFKELKSDLGIEMPQCGLLDGWARQGVLLLNATLTVRHKESASHYGKGWEIFTDAILDKIAQREDPVIFVLWGRHAQEKCQRVLKDKMPPHVALCAPHPSPFSAHQGFFGCRHFSQINTLLEKWGKSPIQWAQTRGDT